MAKYYFLSFIIVKINKIDFYYYKDTQFNFNISFQK